MDFLQSVIRAEYEGGFRIHFTFSDNVRGTIDLQDWFEGPIFEPLKDRTYFQRFSIDGGTVVWPNGADIAPETLYEAVKIAGAAQRAGATARLHAERRGSVRGVDMAHRRDLGTIGLGRSPG